MSEIAEKLTRVYREAAPPDDPMLDFDERDLVVLAEEAGFFPVELTLTAEIRPADARPLGRASCTAPETRTCRRSPRRWIAP